MEIYQTHYLEDDSDLVILGYLILIDIVSHSFLVYIYIYMSLPWYISNISPLDSASVACEERLKVNSGRL